MSFIHICTATKSKFYYHSAVDPLVSQCEDGDIRLVGGPTVLDGRVEICLNNAWGAVCHLHFGTQEARVVCGQLGFQRVGQSYLLIVTIHFI